VPNRIFRENIPAFEFLSFIVLDWQPGYKIRSSY
jgi:hypothetical protein